MKIKNVELKIIQGSIADLDVDCVVEQIGANDVRVEGKVRSFCREALENAKQKEYKSMAFPPLGCAGGNFSLIGSAKIMTQEVLRFVKCDSSKLQEISFCVADESAFETFEQTVCGYVTHIQDTLGDGPYVTVDAIIELPEGIILIERSNPPYGWALPGGFVDYGESLEQAVTREAKEETNMELTDVRQFHTYSHPDRDPRFHTISTVFTATGKGTPQFGDDAKGLKVVSYEDLKDLEYSFDHKQVILDYLRQRDHNGK